jgi:serine/threonine protein kinase
MMQNYSHQFSNPNNNNNTNLCTTNASRFAPKEKLGQGTYGVVFRCDDLQTGQSVAMKKIVEQRSEEGVPAIAIREISLLREVQHPNVVALHHVIPREKELLLIFEYVDQDLKKLLDSRLTPFHGQKLKWIMYQLLQGMAVCHAKRIVHRDLKPQNILVSKNEGVVKIADFGLARAFHVSLHSYTKEVVTLWYRAPEILLGEKHYRPSIDIWSLGCIMAELATKKALFPGDCEIHQLFLIFKAFGTPNDLNWPGVSQLSSFNTEYPKWTPMDLRLFVPGLDSHGLNLLKGLLQVDPLERISAAAALQHPWFDEIRDAYSQQFAEYKNW